MKNDNVLKEAKRLYDLGFAILWIMPKEKRPVESGWTTGLRKSWPELVRSYRPGYNVGVRTGRPSQVGRGFLACIDVDVKDTNYLNEAYAKVSELIGSDGAEFPKVRSGSGNGSRHLYCITEEPFKMLTIAKEKDKFEVCLYSDGRQMLLPPSIHPNGSPYRWFGGIQKASDLPLLDIDRFKFADPEKKPSIFDVRAFTLDFEAEEVNLEWLPISTNIKNAIVNGAGVEDRSAHLIPATTALISAGCTKNEILSVLTDPRYFLGRCAYDHAQTKSRRAAAMWLWKYTVKKVMEERDAVKAFENAAIITNEEGLSEEGVTVQTEEFEKERNWKQDLKRSKGTNDEPGKVISSLNNLDLILSNVTEKPLFQKDEFANREFYACDAPWGAKKGTDLTDIDVVLAKSWISKSEFNFEPKNQVIEEAMALLSHKNGMHPVRDWLNSLNWDGKPRLSTWIKEYLGGDAP